MFSLFLLLRIKGALGSQLRDYSSYSFRFILGKQSKYLILNLEKSLLQLLLLRKLFFLMCSKSRKYSDILFVEQREFFFPLVKRIALRGGFHSFHLVESTKSDFKLFSTQWPEFLFVFYTSMYKVDTFPLHFANQKMFNIAIVNAGSDTRHIHYPIYFNDKSFQSLYFLTSLVTYMYKKASKKRKKNSNKFIKQFLQEYFYMDVEYMKPPFLTFKKAYNTLLFPSLFLMRRAGSYALKGVHLGMGTLKLYGLNPMLGHTVLGYLSFKKSYVLYHHFYKNFRRYFKPRSINKEAIRMGNRRTLGHLIKRVTLSRTLKGRKFIKTFFRDFFFFEKGRGNSFSIVGLKGPYIKRLVAGAPKVKKIQRKSGHAKVVSRIVEKYFTNHNSGYHRNKNEPWGLGMKGGSDFFLLSYLKIKKKNSFFLKRWLRSFFLSHVLTLSNIRSYENKYIFVRQARLLRSFASHNSLYLFIRHNPAYLPRVGKKGLKSLRYSYSSQVSLLKENTPHKDATYSSLLGPKFFNYLTFFYRFFSHTFQEPGFSLITPAKVSFFVYYRGFQSKGKGCAKSRYLSSPFWHHKVASLGLERARGLTVYFFKAGFVGPSLNFKRNNLKAFLTGGSVRKYHPKRLGLRGSESSVLGFGDESHRNYLKKTDLISPFKRRGLLDNRHQRLFPDKPSFIFSPDLKSINSPSFWLNSWKFSKFYTLTRRHPDMKGYGTWQGTESPLGWTLERLLYGGLPDEVIKGGLSQMKLGLGRKSKGMAAFNFKGLHSVQERKKKMGLNSVSKMNKKLNLQARRYSSLSPKPQNRRPPVKSGGGKNKNNKKNKIQHYKHLKKMKQYQKKCKLSGKHIIAKVKKPAVLPIKGSHVINEKKEKVFPENSKGGKKPAASWPKNLKRAIKRGTEVSKKVKNVHAKPARVAFKTPLEFSQSEFFRGGGGLLPVSLKKPVPQHPRKFKGKGSFKALPTRPENVERVFNRSKNRLRKHQRVCKTPSAFGKSLKKRFRRLGKLKVGALVPKTLRYLLVKAVESRYNRKLKNPPRAAARKTIVNQGFRQIGLLRFRFCSRNYLGFKILAFKRKPFVRHSKKFYIKSKQQAFFDFLFSYKNRNKTGSRPPFYLGKKRSSFWGNNRSFFGFDSSVGFSSEAGSSLPTRGKAPSWEKSYKFPRIFKGTSIEGGRPYYFHLYNKVLAWGLFSLNKGKSLGDSRVLHRGIISLTTIHKLKKKFDFCKEYFYNYTARHVSHEIRRFYKRKATTGYRKFRTYRPLIKPGGKRGYTFAKNVLLKKRKRFFHENPKRTIYEFRHVIGSEGPTLGELEPEVEKVFKLERYGDQNILLKKKSVQFFYFVKSKPEIGGVLKEFFFFYQFFFLYKASPFNLNLNNFRANFFNMALHLPTPHVLLGLSSCSLGTLFRLPVIKNRPFTNFLRFLRPRLLKGKIAEGLTRAERVAFTKVGALRRAIKDGPGSTLGALWFAYPGACQRMLNTRKDAAIHLFKTNRFFREMYTTKGRWARQKREVNIRRYEAWVKANKEHYRLLNKAYIKKQRFQHEKSEYFRKDKWKRRFPGKDHKVFKEWPFKPKNLERTPHNIIKPGNVERYLYQAEEGDPHHFAPEFIHADRLEPFYTKLYSLPEPCPEPPYSDKVLASYYAKVNAKLDAHKGERALKQALRKATGDIEKELLAADYFHNLRKNRGRINDPFKKKRNFLRKDIRLLCRLKG